MAPGIPLASEENGESSGGQKIYCSYCRQEGNYNGQCPMKSKEKKPSINMVIAEVTDVQQVTTRSKGKVAEWETQEVIHKQAT